MNKKSNFKIPRREMRFPTATNSAQIMKHQCLWCIQGDLCWDNEFDEWFCAQCGWREYELSRAERRNGVNKIPLSGGGTSGLTGKERLPIGDGEDYDKG